MSVKSKYKGLSWRIDIQCWDVNIYLNNRKIHVGNFRGKESERQAAIAYDKKRILLGLEPENILKPLKNSAA